MGEINNSRVLIELTGTLRIFADDQGALRVDFSTEDKILSPVAPSKKVKSEQYVAFENQFWPIYPKKVAKPQALRAWIKLNPNPNLTTLIVQALKFQTGPGGPLEPDPEHGMQYIPYPATWLNGRRWEDSVHEVLEKAEETSRPMTEEELDKLDIFNLRKPGDD